MASNYGFSDAEKRLNIENQINDFERQKWTRQLDRAKHKAIFDRANSAKGLKSGKEYAQVTTSAKQQSQSEMLGCDVDIEKCDIILAVLRAELASIPEPRADDADEDPVIG